MRQKGDRPRNAVRRTLQAEKMSESDTILLAPSARWKGMPPGVSVITGCPSSSVVDSRYQSQVNEEDEALLEVHEVIVVAGIL